MKKQMLLHSLFCSFKDTRLKPVCIYTCHITSDTLGLQDKRNEIQTGLKEDCVTVSYGVYNVVLTSGTTVSWGFDSIMGNLPHF